MYTENDANIFVNKLEAHSSRLRHSTKTEIISQHFLASPVTVRVHWD
jgi:hypothetical protein